MFRFHDRSKTTLPIIFLHIAKTAGMSLRGHFEKNYRSHPHFNTNVSSVLHDWDTCLHRLEALPPQELDSYRVFKGHMRFGLHEKLPFPAAYITFLREPVPRIVSHYRMALRLNELPSDHVIDPSRPDWNLGSCPDFAPFWDNGQTRLLAGTDPQLPFGQCDETHLQAAIDNMDRHFKFVGLTEQFDLSLLILGRILGWRWHFYIPDNVAHEPPPTLSPEVLQAIHDLNRHDRALYDYARQRLDSLCKVYGLPLLAEQTLFRAGNFIHTQLHIWRHRLKQRLGIERRPSQFLSTKAEPTRQS